MSSAFLATPNRQSIGFLLSQIGAHAADVFADRVQPLGLTPAHAGILRVIDASGGVSQRALAGHLKMFPSRLVLVLDQMQERKLIERKPKANDRRSHALFLTAKGEEKLAALTKISREHEDILCGSLSAKERQILGQLLMRIADAQELTPGVHPGYKRTARDGKC